jgi:hypothetical protein
MKGDMSWIKEQVTVTPDGHWEWNGSIHPKGTPMHNGGSAYRLAWNAAFLELADDMRVVRCPEHRTCVNPEHLGAESIHVHNENLAVNWGRRNYGLANGNAKLSDEDVAYIREGHESIKKCAHRFGVCHEAVRQIRKGLRRVAA